MSNRARDWLAQAEQDLELAGLAQANGRHDWACFAAQQAAEKAVKAPLSSTTANSRAARRSPMPVRSLHSSVLRWPDPSAVEAALRVWAAEQAAARPELRRLGYFGSYATGNWGVGSDLDLVALVDASPRPFAERGRDWDVTGLPVPAEILIYTEAEWEGVLARGDRFARVMATEVVWVVQPG